MSIAPKIAPQDTAQNVCIWVESSLPLTMYQCSVSSHICRLVYLFLRLHSKSYNNSVSCKYFAEYPRSGELSVFQYVYQTSHPCVVTGHWKHHQTSVLSWMTSALCLNNLSNIILKPLMHQKLQCLDLCIYSVQSNIPIGNQSKKNFAVRPRKAEIPPTGPSPVKTRWKQPKMFCVITASSETPQTRPMPKGLT